MILLKFGLFENELFVAKNDFMIYKYDIDKVNNPENVKSTF